MKTLVIYDGSNFYHRAKELCQAIHLTRFNYRKLAQDITGEQDLNIDYCVGEIRQNDKSSKTKLLYPAQQSLFYTLEKQQVRIMKGYMLESGGVFHEKGVDVRMAITLVGGALKNEYTRCFLVSSDTDLIPAIKEARVAGKDIIYVGFQHFISNALRANCSSTRVVTKEMIEGCADEVRMLYNLGK